MAKMILDRFDVRTGEFTYQAEVAIPNEAKTLTFKVKGGQSAPGKFWVQPIFDTYEADSVEEAMKRMELWMKISAQVFSLIPTYRLPPSHFVEPDTLKTNR